MFFFSLFSSKENELNSSESILPFLSEMCIATSVLALLISTGMEYFFPSSHFQSVGIRSPEVVCITELLCCTLKLTKHCKSTVPNIKLKVNFKKTPSFRKHYTEHKSYYDPDCNIFISTPQHK